MSAAFRNGVLTVTLPKTAAAKATPIPVKAEPVRHPPPGRQEHGDDHARHQGSRSGHRRGSGLCPYREAWRNTMIAGDLMTPDPITVIPEASVAEAWRMSFAIWTFGTFRWSRGGLSSAC